jgi:chromosomal replication initiation ATPase DnaA
MMTTEAAVPGDRNLLDVLRSLVSRQQYDLWFASLQPVCVAPGGVRLAVANPFIRDWLSTYYSDVLHAAVRECLGTDAPLDLMLAPAVAGASSCKMRIWSSPAPPHHQNWVRSRMRSSLSSGRSNPAVPSALRRMSRKTISFPIADRPVRG